MNEDYAQYSNTGAVVTVVCAVICFALFVTEVVGGGTQHAARSARRRAFPPRCPCAGGCPHVTNYLEGRPEGQRAKL